MLQRLQATTLAKHLFGGLLCDAAVSGKAGDLGADMPEGAVVGEDGDIGL